MVLNRGIPLWSSLDGMFWIFIVIGKLGVRYFFLNECSATAVVLMR